MQVSGSDSYAKAGVDVKAGYESVARITPHIMSTRRSGVIGGFGGFGGLFEPDLSGMKRPVAVSGTDGVGTKLKIAFLMDKHDTIGIDCVAMCVNDIVCAGAEPQFFLDYIAMGRNDPARTERIVAGVAEGCRQANCALVGGEMAEHPDMMPDDEYDIAGFSVGFVDHANIIDGRSIAQGDVIIGLTSTGLHSNGFSLVRKVLRDELGSLSTYMPELGCTLGEELLRPTRVYVRPLLNIIRQFGKEIKGVSHISGGGFYENIPRMLPPGVGARIGVSALPKLPVFEMLARKGNISARDMFDTFNMGVGMAITVGADKADAVLAALRVQGEAPLLLGDCVSGERGVELA